MGTGPYRQVLTEICDELQEPGFLDLFIANSNADLSDSKAPNQSSCVVNPSAGSEQTLERYEFLGKLIGMAIRNSSTGTMLPLDLTSCFWKQISREKLSLGDFVGFDHAQVLLVKGLRNTTEETFAGVLDNMEKLGESTMMCTRLSCGREIELIPGGKKIPLTFERREEYAWRLVRARLAESRYQMGAIRRGIASIVPAELLRLFTWKEIEEMVCGKPTVDLDLLRSQTCYSGDFENAGGTNKIVTWLWNILEDFNHEQRTSFLKFAWARPRLPLTADDFNMQFDVHGDPGMDCEQLPTSATCFFRINLSPFYASCAEMKKKLLISMQSGDLDADDIRGSVDRSAFGELQL